MLFDIKYFLLYLLAGTKQLPMSLMLSITSLIIGLTIGTVLALMRTCRVHIFNKFSQVYVTVIRGIPIVLQLLLVYFLVLYSFDKIAVALNISLRAKDVPLSIVVIIAFSLNASAYLAENIRSALLSINKGQYEAAYSIGMTNYQTMKRIILPQLLPVFLPPLCNNFIGTFKATSIAYLVSVLDVMNATITAASKNYRYMEAYTAAAVIYWLVCILAERSFFNIEKRVNRIYSDKVKF